MLPVWNKKMKLRNCSDDADIPRVNSDGIGLKATEWREKREGGRIGEEEIAEEMMEIRGKNTNTG